MSIYASGFTNISDLAFAGKNLLVLELTTKGLYGPRSPGALVRVTPSGARKVIASKGLAYPTGLAVGNGSIYVSNHGLFPASGAGPHGELVRLPLQRSGPDVPVSGVRLGLRGRRLRRTSAAA